MENIYYPLRELRILSGSRGNTFGMVRKKGTKAHQGWDLEARNNSLLYAVAEGEIVNVDRDGQFVLRLFDNAQVSA